MHPQLMWWTARATGMVAAVLLVASLVWGVLLATRALRGLDRPAWLLAMHRWFSALACIGIALHLLALVGDNYVHFGWKELFVPGGAQDAWPGKGLAVSLGVFALYLLVLVQVTSLLKRRLPKRLWRVVHLSSYAAVWLSVVHAATAGTDVGNRVYQAVSLFVIILAVTAAVVWVMLGATRSRATRQGGRGVPEPGRGEDRCQPPDGTGPLRRCPVGASPD